MNISLAPEVLFHIGQFPVTNTIMVSWVIVASSFVFAAALRIGGMSLVPRGVQNALEALLEAWLKLIDPVTNSRTQTLAFFPIVTSIFVYVALSNLVELVPGLGTVGLYGEHEGRVALIPFIRSSSADLNFTIGLALFTMAATWVFGIRTRGVGGHLGKFFNFSNPLNMFVGLLEFVGEFARIISFSFRLFGNIFAGEVLLIVVASLAPVIAGLPFLFLELFVGLVQALVFAMLALVFLKMATEGHGEETAQHTQ